MRRVKYSVASLFALFLVCLLSMTALAVSPHFITASASGPDSAGNLTVSWKEAGLGNNQQIMYTASADAKATFACINGGGKHPKASNKQTVSGPVTATGTFSSDKNGTISQHLQLNPPSAGSFACPSGQRFVQAFVSYTGVSIMDTTNEITESIPGTFSKCFVDPGLGLCS